MIKQQHTILVIDDAPQDREIYRRYLQADPECNYTILEEESATAGLKLCEGVQIDGVLLDLRLPDRNGLEFLQELQAKIGSNGPAVLVITGQGNEKVAARSIKYGAEDYLVKQDLTPQGLCLALRTAIENAKLRHQLRQSQAREHLINKIALKIHRSLQLDHILQTTVTEVRDFLHCDRVLIVRMQGDRGLVMAESVAAPWLAIGTTPIFDPCFQNGYAELYRQGRVTAKTDIEDGSLDPCYVELLRKFAVRANLVIPLLQHDSLWGLLIAHQCRTTRSWPTQEIELMQHLATQVGIALQQSELYQQARQELQERQQAETVLAALQQEHQHRAEQLEALNEELQNALEELQVTEEELRLQNEELCLARQLQEEQQQRYQDLFNFAPDAYLVSDAQGLIQEANRAACLLLGAGVEALIGTPLLLYVAEAERREFRTQLYELNQAPVPQPQSFELHLHSDCGEPFPAAITVSAISDPQGKRLGFRWLIRNITERKQAELALQQSEARLRQLVDLNLIGVMFWDVDGRILDANQSFLNLVGYDRSDLDSGQLNWRSLTPPEQLAASEDTLTAMQHCTSAILEKEYIHSEGHRVPILLGGVRFADSQTRGVSFVLDLSERKQTQQALQKANERFELAAAAVTSLIWEWDLQTDRIERSCGLVELTGYGLEEAEPTPNWWLEKIHPEDLAKMDQSGFFQQLPTLDRYAGEYRIHHKEGHYVWVEERGLVVKDQQGHPIRIVGSTTDISDRKGYELALQASQDIIRSQLLEIEALYQTAPVGLAFLDQNLRFQQVNQTLADINGVALEDHLGRTVREVVPELADQVEPLLRQVLETGEPRLNLEIEGETAAAPGLRRTWLESWFPFRKSAAEVSGINIVVLEVTERKQLQQQREVLLAAAEVARQEAEQANRAKDEFIAVVSHELRSPLNAILGWAKLLQTRSFEPAMLKRGLETIERNVETQVQLIEDLLDISRMARGTLRLNFMPVNLVALVEETLLNLQPSITANQLDLVYYPGSEEIRVSGDLHRLQQVFANLLTNAIKFTPAGGQVEVRFVNCGAQVQIMVIDTGKGIAADFLPYIFDRFRQGNDAREPQEGLGLGLAIVRHLVELHKGTIQAASAGPGQGATFTVTLPTVSSL